MRPFLPLALLFLALTAHAEGPSCSLGQRDADPQKECEGTANDPNDPCPGQGSYEGTVKGWSPEDVNRWVGKCFRYNTNRAINDMSENGGGGKNPVMAPQDVFNLKCGVCLDVTNFAYKQLQDMVKSGHLQPPGNEPELQPRIVLVKFNPCTIKGKTLSKHWMVSFKRSAGGDKIHTYFIGDSKFPGMMHGPFECTKQDTRKCRQDFQSYYQGIRHRQIQFVSEQDNFGPPKK